MKETVKRIEPKSTLTDYWLPKIIMNKNGKNFYGIYRLKAEVGRSIHRFNYVAYSGSFEILNK
jgi:hypothetical protein